MPASREEVWQALEDLLTARLAGVARTVDRRLKSWASTPVDKRPALFISESPGERPEQRPAEPPKRVWEGALLCLVEGSEDDTLPTSTALNAFMDAVEGALRPDNGSGRLTLGGLVREVRRTGQTPIWEGDLDGTDTMSSIMIEIVLEEDRTGNERTFVFGAGAMYVKPLTVQGERTALGPRASVRLGALQDVEITGDGKLDLGFVGGPQYPAAGALSTRRLRLRARFAQIDGMIADQLMFGANRAAGATLAVQDEAHTITGTSLFDETFETYAAGVPLDGQGPWDVASNNSGGSPRIQVVAGGAFDGSQSASFEHASPAWVNVSASSAAVGPFPLPGLFSFAFRGKAGRQSVAALWPTTLPLPGGTLASLWEFYLNPDGSVDFVDAGGTHATVASGLTDDVWHRASVSVEADFSLELKIDGKVVPGTGAAVSSGGSAITGIVLKGFWRPPAVDTTESDYARVDDLQIDGIPVGFSASVPAGGAYTLDLAVVDAQTGLPFDRVASAPDVGEYATDDAGGYTCAFADVGRSVALSYLYAATSGQHVPMGGGLQGAAPECLVVLQATYQGRRVTLILTRVVVPRFALPSPSEQFALADLELEALLGPDGTVGSWNIG